MSFTDSLMNSSGITTKFCLCNVIYANLPINIIDIQVIQLHWKGLILRYYLMERDKANTITLRDLNSKSFCNWNWNKRKKLQVLVSEYRTNSKTVQGCMTTFHSNLKVHSHSCVRDSVKDWPHYWGLCCNTNCWCKCPCEQIHLLQYPLLVSR